MKAPFFSIILTTYNRAHYLQRAVESVLNQTVKDFELIIVDDGSTDNTAQKVIKWDDSRIRYYYKENEERSIARNFGVEKSLGTYVNFLDSDDFFYPNHLETALKVITTEPFPILFQSAFEIRKDNGELLKAKKKWPKDIRQKILDENFLILNSLFAKRDLLGYNPFINSKDAIISEDWYLWIKLLARHPIQISEIVTSVVVEHSERSLNNLDAIKVEKSVSLIIDTLKEDKKVLEFYAGNFEKFAARNFCFIALIFSLNKDFDKANEFLKRASFQYPSIICSRKYLAVKKKLFWHFLKKILRSCN